MNLINMDKLATNFMTFIRLYTFKRTILPHSDLWVGPDFKAVRVLTSDSQYASSSEVLVDCPSEGGEVY